MRVPDYGDIYREAFADALAQNMKGGDGAPGLTETARQYAAEFAEGEVQAAREMAGDADPGPAWLWAASPSGSHVPGRLPVTTCGRCGALVAVAIGARHRSWHQEVGA